MSFGDMSLQRPEEGPRKQLENVPRRGVGCTGPAQLSEKPSVDVHVAGGEWQSFLGRSWDSRIGKT